jgi:hypothetical protein
MTYQQSLLLHLKKHSIELRELDIGDSIESVPSPLLSSDFLRSYVAGNKPCLITNVVTNWPAFTAWDKQYLKARAGSNIVTVDYTPNGRGDSITTFPDQNGDAKTCFCTPLELQLPFGQFIDEYLTNNTANRIPYLQVSTSQVWSTTLSSTCEYWFFAELVSCSLVLGAMRRYIPLKYSLSTWNDLPWLFIPTHGLVGSQNLHGRLCRKALSHIYHRIFWPSSSWCQT